MSKIFLYAEVLTNIRQVTLYASLQTAETPEETVVHISSDKKRVTVSEGDISSGIYLPTEISGTADVTIARGKKKEISVRLEIGDTSELLHQNDLDTAIEVPWSAQDLTPKTTIQCKQCQATIVASGKITSWKDLPSENWAEMMDFGIAINPMMRQRMEMLQRRKATPQGAPKLDTSKSSPILKCKSCSCVLGERDTHLNAIKFFKPRLAVQLTPNHKLTSYDPSIFINAQLLLSIESLAVRKFILHTALPASAGLHIWVFNPDIHYSSSVTGPFAHRATKVFYQAITNFQHLLDLHATTLEELILPQSILDDFTSSLVASTRILPESARSFQEWNVGLLGRYERKPISGMEQQPLANKLGPLINWPESVEYITGIEDIFRA